MLVRVIDNYNESIKLKNKKSRTIFSIIFFLVLFIVIGVSMLLMCNFSTMFFGCFWLWTAFMSAIIYFLLNVSSADEKESKEVCKTLHDLVKKYGVLQLDSIDDNKLNFIFGESFKYCLNANNVDISICHDFGNKGVKLKCLEFSGIISDFSKVNSIKLVMDNYNLSIEIN